MTVPAVQSPGKWAKNVSRLVHSTSVPIPRALLRGADQASFLSPLVL